MTSNSCLRSANLLEAGFVKHQGVSPRAQSAQQAMPTACSSPGQLASGPQSRGWGLWALGTALAGASGWVGLRFEGVSGQSSLPSSRLGWLLHCC